MPYVDFYLKIKNKKQLENIFSQLDTAKGIVNWKNHWKDKIAPFRKENLAKWLEIDNLTDKQMFPYIEDYLKEHHYEELLSDNWENSEFKVGNIVYSSSLLEHADLNKKIEMFNENDGISYIDSSDNWLAFLGLAEKLPFKLIAKICQKEDILFLSRFDESILIAIDNQEIKSIRLDFEALVKDSIPQEFFDLNILSNIEKKELALANILLSENITCLSEDINYIQMLPNKQELINKIAIRVRDNISIFEMDENEFNSLCNNYFLYKSLETDLKYKLQNGEIEEEKKTKI